MPPETRAISKDIPKSQQHKTDTLVFKWLSTIAGILLCLTGVGIIIGLPLIIAAWRESPRYDAPALVWEAPCPYCGMLLHVNRELHGSNCIACEKRFIVRSGYFVGID